MCYILGTYRMPHEYNNCTLFWSRTQPLGSQPNKRFQREKYIRYNIWCVTIIDCNTPQHVVVVAEARGLTDRQTNFCQQPTCSSCCCEIVKAKIPYENAVFCLCDLHDVIIIFNTIILNIWLIYRRAERTPYKNITSGWWYSISTFKNKNKIGLSTTTIYYYRL